jgi:FlaA1/EpsC-like NDP-sugar epimerase
VPFLGTANQAVAIAGKYEVREILVIANSLLGKQLRDLIKQCRQAEVAVKMIPSVEDLLNGQYKLQVRDVNINDLLGRKPVVMDSVEISEMLQGRCVLVTGAGGSVGSEICRQVAQHHPSQLILLERAENNLFNIELELRGRHRDLNCLACIGDVCDRNRLRAVFQSYRPHVVFHAAAHKHVPMMEWNPGEAIKNNVFGTRKVADAAHGAGCEAFVLVSTDKAVNPTSVMGASKRVAEMYVQALSQTSRTKFVAVRFGNVLGSAGSVVPIFKAQIAAGGPVTVTHPDMKRHFMTIPEASQLVMQASAMGRSGEILMLDMGEPVRIAALAEDLIRLSGFEPGIDIAIEFTGVRPGEKLYEDLAFDAEKMEKTRHEKIFVGKLGPCGLPEVEAKLEGLSRVTGSTSLDDVRGALAAAIPEMREPPFARPPPEPDAAAAESGARVPAALRVATVAH